MTLRLIDSHCHLDFDVFDADRNLLLQRAAAEGVADIIVPGVTAERWAALLELCRSDRGLYPALGLHPCFLDQHNIKDLTRLERLLEREAVVAVGEIGLDLFIPGADLKHQLEYLLPQLALARQFNLPVLLHVRKAHDQMLQQLRRCLLPRGGIVHAFSGSLQQAEQYLQLGFRLGIGGTITYPRANRLRTLVQQLPLESFVLETDAPDMPLQGFQGQRNLPERVRRVAETMAELRGCSLEQIAAQTTQTSESLLALA
ncbi:TatD family hydrolase [Neptuniibacter sp. CAU 1671]|uniref:TatD family hydrolase n=1 Tax=Neptuniibacter sp. CAU 1671 TaxID=3032593 RepID=UPI0023DA1802|nr:TatD family hydrolase [Neptuniibacter sp. CAU 1671]MDF2181753.1 TatD family hydrolase [Neptuniibacter sp. CAU 1671]